MDSMPHDVISSMVPSITGQKKVAHWPPVSRALFHHDDVNANLEQYYSFSSGTTQLFEL